MKHLYSLFVLLASMHGLQAQRTCGTMLHLSPERLHRLSAMGEAIRAHGPSHGALAGSRGTLTIPVVVHVLWNAEEQNISDQQVYDQMDILNEDFRLQNLDAPDESHPFWFESQDTFIEFCLAQQDPDGFETTGINRVWTPYSSWDESMMDMIKSSEDGGVDNWDPEHYLNIWVVETDPDFGLLGWATFPDELETNPWMDGVVVRNSAFGFMGTAVEPNDLGRTATHEVGHWLSLRHIWGDDICGDDEVDDTPPAYDANYGCPEFPHRPFSECGSDEYGEMYMNFMDYVDDYCMNMFSTGQAERMWAALDIFRSGLFESIACEPGTPAGMDDLPAAVVRVFPNPVASDMLHFSLVQDGPCAAVVQDASGRRVWQGTLPVQSGVGSLDVSSFPEGVYLLQLRSNSGQIFRNRFVVQ